MAKKSPAKKKAASPKKPATARKDPAPKKAVKKMANPQAGAERAAEARRKKSLKALATYENALGAIQNRKLSSAATLFQKVINNFPDERELHERSRRYLEVCLRQTTPPPTPETLEERVYAATLALNDGATKEALAHLEAAAVQAPDSEQVHYMLAVARAATGDHATAVSHLDRAIELNPDNRFLARHEPTFQGLKEDERFRRMVTSARSGSPQHRQ